MKKDKLEEYITFRCTKKMKELAEGVALTIDPDRGEVGSYARSVLREALTRRGLL